MKLPPLSLYVHIPWCIRKCPYCDFNSHEKEQFPEAAYTQALIEDLYQQQSLAQGRALKSIFFGGGTPSLFSAASIQRIIDTARDTLGFDPRIEITLEANPGTFEQEKFADYYSAGVNRLSVGIQSFNDHHLKRLGRIHTSSHAQRAIKQAKAVGFESINIDLMHGLPEQTPEDALSDLSIATELNPTHISWYQLTIEPNTAFYKQPPVLPQENLLESIQKRGEHYLQQHHFTAYEISAFAKPGQASVHNTNYWQFGDYMGIGAGAHGKITNSDEQYILRSQKTRLPEHYIKNTDSMLKRINSDDLVAEFLMNSLRLHGGVPMHYFTERTGLPLDHLMNKIAPFYKQLLIKDDSERLQTTELGARFLNVILEKLI